MAPLEAQNGACCPEFVISTTTGRSGSPWAAKMEIALRAAMAINQLSSGYAILYTLAPVAPSCLIKRSLNGESTVTPNHRSHKQPKQPREATTFDERI